MIAAKSGRGRKSTVKDLGDTLHDATTLLREAAAEMAREQAICARGGSVSLPTRLARKLVKAVGGPIFERGR